MQGKVAVVTGGARGIGRATVLALAKRGARVVVNDLHSMDEAQVVAREVEAAGSTALVQQADVADRGQMEGLFEAAVARFGRVDIVVANAARNVRKPLLELSVEDVEATWGVTQWGVFHACQLGARQMVAQGGGGSMVVVSSIHSFRPYSGASAYNGAKAAVNQMAKTWALELADHGIRVNVVEPGWTDTPGERGYFTEEELAAGGGLVPLGRLADPAEIARAVVFLASDEASYLTGAVLRADGGYHLRH
ncbi:MAG TPA: SDR family oxidoreductase [Bryobacteraceae bacterium]|nr:NAD(P)-dependent oxidoreductase [Bryobacterales bacterium]HRJ20823.1 SDR family oxidoreductase [Bryobacteraceae bacterium]